VIVATVGAASLSLFRSRSRSRAIVKVSDSSIVSAVVGTLTVPVVARRYVTVCEVVV
jgi:hypothetical protein